MNIQTFEEEVLKIERLLYRVSWSMLSNQEDCADAIQEALARAWQKRDSLRNIKAFRSWLIQILGNVCKDMLRRRQREPQVPLTEEILATLVIESNNLHIADLLQSLSAEHRTTIVLHYLEGYKIREIATMLDTPVGTIKTRLMTARTYLRDAINAQSEPQGGLHYEKA